MKLFRYLQVVKRHCVFKKANPVKGTVARELLFN